MATKGKKSFVGLADQIDLLNSKHIEHIRSESLKNIKANLLKARKQVKGMLEFLTSARSEAGKSSKSISERLILACSYIQGMDNTFDMIITGHYIQSASLIRQEYEIYTRIVELLYDKAKYGKTPNPSIHPTEGYKKIYGELSDIAHVSKSNITEATLSRLIIGERRTISPSVQFDKDFMISLFETHLLILINITVERMRLFEDMYGEDSKEIKMCEEGFQEACNLLKGMQNYYINPDYL